MAKRPPDAVPGSGDAKLGNDYIVAIVEFAKQKCVSIAMTLTVASRLNLPPERLSNRVQILVAAAA
ncbi:MAG: hypothetical protein JXQ99_15535, partial [Hyphomicrobiaceae bacterium]